MSKKRYKFGKIPKSDGMIRLVSFIVAVLIVGLPLLLRESPARPGKTSEGTNIELLLCTGEQEAAWLERQKVYNPGAFFSFSRPPEKIFLPESRRRLISGTVHSDIVQKLPEPRKLAVARLPELPQSSAPFRTTLFPPSVRQEEREFPQVRFLTVLDGQGKSTGMTIAPVSYRGKMPRPVLFQIRSGRCGNDLRLLHSSGDRAFDAGVRRRLLQNGVSGSEGKLLCIWPEVKVKEVNL